LITNQRTKNIFYNPLSDYVQARSLLVLQIHKYPKRQIKEGALICALTNFIKGEKFMNLWEKKAADNRSEEENAYQQDVASMKRAANQSLYPYGNLSVEQRKELEKSNVDVNKQPHQQKTASAVKAATDYSKDIYGDSDSVNNTKPFSTMNTAVDNNKSEKQGSTALTGNFQKAVNPRAGGVQGGNRGKYQINTDKIANTFPKTQPAEPNKPDFVSMFNADVDTERYERYVGLDTRLYSKATDNLNNLKEKHAKVLEAGIGYKDQMKELRRLEKEIGLSEKTVADIGNRLEKNNNTLNSLYKHHEASLTESNNPDSWKGYVYKTLKNTGKTLVALSPYDPVTPALDASEAAGREYNRKRAQNMAEKESADAGSQKGVWEGKKAVFSKLISALFPTGPTSPNPIAEATKDITVDKGIKIGLDSLDD